MIRSYIRKGILVLGMVFCSLFLCRLLPTFLVSRFLPSLFGFLVSSSPIIVCTALLLGILLSFGQTNTLEAKEKENQTPVTSLRRRSIADDLVVNKAARVKEEAIKEAAFGKEIEEVSISKRAVTEDNGRKINGLRKPVKVENRGLLNDIQGHANDDCRAIEGQKFNVHNDSGSHKESSLDASMTEVIPMLDELHPLIETEAQVPTLTPQDESDAHDSDIGSADLAGDVENADEEEAQEKAVVTWTEDDAKNLNDLGKLELERNLRLEKLIAKRRARRKWMFEAEKNLIDFDSNDGMQISIPARRNPFDAPFDLDETLGLSPAPGSAPSILLPRFNPFDLPFDQLDERGNFSGENSSEQEYVMPQQRDTFFRRYESFTLGASFLGETKQEKHDFKFRPYFVPEGTEYDTSFPNQLDEKNDYKVSSIPESDTTSTSSIADPEDDNQELLEQELPAIGESSCFQVHASERIERDSESSEEVDMTEINSNPSEANNDKVEEPVYDSSPSAISVSLHNNTASSETSSDAPPVTVDRRNLDGDGESMLITGNEREDTGSNNEGSLAERQKVPSEDEIKSRSKGDADKVSEHNVIQGGEKLEPVASETSEDASLSSPVSKSMQDEVMDDREKHQSK